MSEKELDYPEAARVVYLWLKNFCDESLKYPDMIAESARRARAEIDSLKAETKSLKSKPTLEDVCELGKKTSDICKYQTMSNTECCKCNFFKVEGGCILRDFSDDIAHGNYPEALALFQKIRGVR